MRRELLEEGERLHPLLAELALHVLEREPGLAEPLDELQLQGRIDGPQDRDEIANVVDDLDAVDCCGHAASPTEPGPGPIARNMRRYFPYRSVGLNRAGWGVRVPDLHSGHSAWNVYRPQARQTRSMESRHGRVNAPSPPAALIDFRAASVARFIVSSACLYWLAATRIR